MPDTGHIYDGQSPLFVSHFPLRGRGVVLVFNSKFQGEVPRNGRLALDGKHYEYVGPEFLFGPNERDMAVIVSEDSAVELLKGVPRISFV